MSARLVFTCLVAVGLLSACERPPMQSAQQGIRGTGMQDVQNPRLATANQAALPAVPDLPPPGSNDGPKAKDVYQNVKVLGDLSVGEFTRHMLAITAWVSPEQGCTYCHGANLADDSLYTKVVSRRMIEMTRHLNVDWAKHVGTTGVTCYTCHRGQPVPANVSFAPMLPHGNRAGMGLGDDAGQNKAEPSIALASLPYDPFTPYLSGAETIRVQNTTALPTDEHRTSIKQAEFTYSLMNHISKSLGVNCTFCHNTQSFMTWNDKRVTAWHGIRMARDVNNAYLEPLTKTFPANRLGAAGDVAKVNCATCHQGVNKPLAGLAMAKNWPGLMTTALAAPAAAAAATAAAPAAPAALAAPAVVAAAPAQPLKTVIYFPVNSPLLRGDEPKKLDAVLAALNAQPSATATISGFHSATGKLAANQELSKQRAFKVRDALVNAGIAAGRIKLDKPQQSETANVKGEDASSRRVEVTVK